MKLTPDVQKTLDKTIRHVQQEERAGAMQSALELGKLLADSVRALDKHTGWGPLDAVQKAWSQLEAVQSALVGVGGQGGPIARRVLGAFDEIVRASPNEGVRNYNQQQMKEARGS